MTPASNCGLCIHVVTLAREKEGQGWANETAYRD